ncbi:protein fantom-like isoform X2 [Panulirus ornatus]|uniref:protein fantom-like isoform X2 n=1 Tax=Panulirus ornatus TaxID=150431 RepID=UPI003A851CBF
MSTSDDYQVPVRDGHSLHPKHTVPEEMYWLSHLSQEELLEKYVGLRDDFYTLKKFTCKQEDKIKKLQTKLRKLIADRKKDSIGKGNTSLTVQEMEYQDALETHRQSIRELHLKNEHLEKKLKLANIQLSTARKNKPLLFRHVGARVDSGLKQTRSSVVPQVRQQVQPKLSPPKPSSSDDSTTPTSLTSHQQRDHALPERVNEILEEARERILALEAERENLQKQLNDKLQEAEDTEYEFQQKIAILEEEIINLREDLHKHGVREERDSVAVVRAEREARTLSARTTALKEQLAVTEEKVEAERSRKDALQSDLERISERLLTAESQLRELQQEYQKAIGQLQQVREKKTVIQNENEQLKRENERLTTLNLSFEQRGLSTENESLKAQIAHLESALQSDLTERGNFLEQLTHDKEALARSEVEMKKLKDRNFRLQEDLEKATQKLNIISKTGLLDMTEKDLADTYMKYKQDGLNRVSVQEVEDLKQAHSELQLLYRERTLELEKITATLASHSETYKALQNQVVSVTQEYQEKEKVLHITIKNLKEAIKRRDEHCEKLEQQMLVITEKGMKDKLEDIGHDKTQTVNLGKHDNVLEFHISSVVFEIADFSQLKTFVSWIVPFSLEDPLQHTNVAIGSDAHYNYSALYKFQMNYRNLESLREDIVTVSVYILLDSGHPAKVGECHITFSEILDHPRNTLHGTVEVLLVHDDAEEAQHLPLGLHMQPGQVIGTLSYWFRLQRPCEDVITQHLCSIGSLNASKHYEHFAPKMGSLIKSKNPTMNKRTGDQEHQENSAGHKSPSSIKVGESSVEQMTEVKQPVQPASRAPSHASIHSENQQSSSQGIEANDFLQKTCEPSEMNKSLSSKQFKSETQTENSTNSNVHEKQQHSESESIGSTGTYNVKSHLKTNTRSYISDNDDHNSPKYVQSEKTSSLDSLSSSNQSISDAECKVSSPVINKKASRSSSLVLDKSVKNSSSEEANETLGSARDFTTDGASHRNHPKKLQFTSSHSLNGSRSQGPDDQRSSSKASITSDSDEVVAIVSETYRDKLSKIYVEVCSLTLHNDCSVIQDPLVEFLFVDYHGFLGLPPDLLETPVSLPKPPPGCSLNFNFGQEFSIDKKQYPERVQALVDLMKNRGIIKFTVTSEPPEELQDTHDCQDLGYAYVDLHEMLKKGHDLEDEDLVVENADGGSQMGTLRVTLHIVEVLKHMDITN